MLFCDMNVQCRGISSDPIVKHQTKGHGATCSNSHSCSSFVFFPKSVLLECSQEGRNRVKKANEINTRESSSCLKLKFVSNIL